MTTSAASDASRWTSTLRTANVSAAGNGPSPSSQHGGSLRAAGRVFSAARLKRTSAIRFLVTLRAVGFSFSPSFLAFSTAPMLIRSISAFTTPASSADNSAVGTTR